MTTEKQFNKWITKQFYETYNKEISVQRIETTTGNGVPDLLVITPSEVWFIESKFQTSNIRPEQLAWQIRANEIIKNENTIVITMCAYPKTKRFLVCKYDRTSISLDKTKPSVIGEFSLDKKGFKDFINYFNASKLV